MGLFFGRKKQEERRQPSIKDEFWQHHAYAGFFAERGNIEGARDELLEALLLTERASDEDGGYRGLAQHLMGRHEWFDIGRGVEGLDYFDKALGDGDAFRRLGASLRTGHAVSLFYDAYLDTLWYKAMAAASYDEAQGILERASQQVQEYDDRYVKLFGAVREALDAGRDAGSRYGLCQCELATSLYPQLARGQEKGDPATALLDLVLERAGQEGYALSDDEYAEAFEAYLEAARALRDSARYRDNPQAQDIVTRKPLARLDKDTRLTAARRDKLVKIGEGLRA